MVRIHFKVQSGVGPTKVLQSRKTIKREASETSPVSGAIPQKVYERLVGKYTEERVQFYLELLTKRPDIKNISAYLIKALQESYYEEDFRISRKVQEERLERIRAKQIRDQRKGQREEISHAFDLHRKELLLRYEQRMEASDIEVFTFLFEESDNAQERKYVKEIRAGEASRLAKNFCVEWYIREYGDKADVRLLDVKHFSKAKYNFDW